MTYHKETIDSENKRRFSESALNNLVSELTAWQNLKAIISDKLLLWAMMLLPIDSPERRELALFVREYLKRSLARRTTEYTANAGGSS